jgi:orotate phosphoribosyltransferase
VCAGLALTAVPIAALTSRRTVRREAAEVVRAFDPSGSPKST